MLFNTLFLTIQVLLDQTINILALEIRPIKVLLQIIDQLIKPVFVRIGFPLDLHFAGFDIDKLILLVCRAIDTSVSVQIVESFVTLRSLAKKSHFVFAQLNGLFQVLVIIGDGLLVVLILFGLCVFVFAFGVDVELGK